MSSAAPLLSDWCAPHFEILTKNINGQSQSAVHKLRENSYSHFMESGYPQAKSLEDWKYTNIKEIASLDFVISSDTDYDKGSIPALFTDNTAITLPFVNGNYAGEGIPAGLPDGVKLQTLNDVLHNTDSALYSLVQEKLGSIADYKENGFAALNTSFVADGVVLHVAKNVECPTPIRIVCIAKAGEKPTVSFPRVLVVLEEGAKATVLEEYVSEGNGAPTFSNSLTEVSLETNSKLDHLVINLEDASCYHYGHIAARQASDSNFKTASYGFGGKIVRNEVRPVLDGTGIYTEMYGLSVLEGKQHTDNYTVLDHAKPHCESNEMYKGIYTDESTGVFCGTIIVREDAQKTNAIQSSSGLLLSDKASLNTKPQLKIWADDVKCTHGATIGQLDKDALFYLRSRGVSKADATAMLVRAFAGDVTKEIDIPELRVFIEDKLAEKLGQK